MAVGQNCGNCGTALGMGASFCKLCGASVRSRNDMKCQTCGNDNEENAQFCEGCGASLSAGRVAARPGLPTVGFGEAISRGFTNYFTFSGRASRPEYWWWMLFTFLVSIIPLSILVTFIPSLAVTSRRLHDIGKSGWWQLLPVALIGWTICSFFAVLLIGPRTFPGLLLNLLPSPGILTLATIASIIVLIIWFVRKGDEGPNRYGLDLRHPTPKSRTYIQGTSGRNTKGLTVLKVIVAVLAYYVVKVIIGFNIISIFSLDIRFSESIGLAAAGLFFMLEILALACGVASTMVVGRISAGRRAAANLGLADGA
jgi:uncharacterized membrane protein YhaH (DUF805 family)